MTIETLFEADITRDIPPVVYFQEKSPEKLRDEVSEYIITGGYPKGHASHRPDGIHENYVRLLNTISGELQKSGGPDLPNVWVSGFYGSGKSSFAKLLGMALDGAELADGSSLADTWLKRNSSVQRQDMVDAWDKLQSQVDSVSVVFDVGGAAKDNENVHSAILRHVQERFGYCSTSANVADYELKLERDGSWAEFEKLAQEELGEPWEARRDDMFADDDFSRVMSKMFPQNFEESTSWYKSRAGTHKNDDSPEDAAKAIGDMLKFRRPGATLFIVVDEVSQYVLSTKGRVDRLRAFASAIGSVLKGKVWLIAIGQQKIDQEADDSFLVWAKDRFPPQLRVHLSPANIQEVVHRRLLKKNQQGEERLGADFDKYRPDLQLYAYGCEEITKSEFVDYYPMLPRQLDLMLRITSAIRTRSGRAQGDGQAIRGLLQVLGELFRAQKLAEEPIKTLVTLDKIYDVQRSDLDSDLDTSMSRILQECQNEDPLLIRCAKTVAMLELVQEFEATTANLVASCLYAKVDQGNQEDKVEAALETLRHRGLLGYNEKSGFKIQSSAGEEWDRERRQIPVGREMRSELVKEALESLLAEPERPKLSDRAFPWAGVFSDGRKMDDSKIVDPRDSAVVRVDFRFLPRDLRSENDWTKRSEESGFRNRLIWVCGETEQVEDAARHYAQSKLMVEKYLRRKGSLPRSRQDQLQDEQHRMESRKETLVKAVAESWLSGSFYFRSKPIAARSEGKAFGTALTNVARKTVGDIYDKFDGTQVSPSEYMLLLDKAQISGPSPKFMVGELGILEKDEGRFVPQCPGQIPQRLLAFIEEEQGLTGQSLLKQFCGPPYAYAVDMVKACLAGLLRGEKIMLQTDAGERINVVSDPGTREVFEKDGKFNKCSIFPARETEITPQLRAKIHRLFKEHLGQTPERDTMSLANAVSRAFPAKAAELRATISQFDRLKVDAALPKELDNLQKALEQCLQKVRETNPTLLMVGHHLDALRDGFDLLNRWHHELTDSTVESVRAAVEVRDNQLQQMHEVDLLPSEQTENGNLLVEHLQGSRPWQDISVLDDALNHIRDAYKEGRSQILSEQGQTVDSVKEALRSRSGFSDLTTEQQAEVLQVVEEAELNTSDEAIAPSLLNLQSQFQVRLEDARNRANEVLDRLLSQGDNPMIVPVDLKLENRELTSEDDIDELLAEIRERLIEQLKSGQRVRLI